MELGQRLIIITGHRPESGHRATETAGCAEMAGGACWEVSAT